MEIQLTPIQVEKLLKISIETDKLKSEINSLYDKLASLKVEVDKKNVHQSDIIETIISCNNIDPNRVFNFKIVEDVMIFDVVEEPQPVEPSALPAEDGVTTE